ncbi:signal transduction histidine kinase [Flavobacterium sp. 28A]|uniref:tetratricopeptide repeat-containing sensor histidine kinase n=1 Tax=Flavobacterium sp. 28A TaxID=2735895 RepID=UPI00156E1976|nr:tetratricopeptide repeat-containing sensor histidine kinase [Flavobacterium sp. 28A]NRT17074.1 signal transduction histidine kinase [Flavobacterium sp. 28A]
MPQKKLQYHPINILLLTLLVLQISCNRNKPENKIAIITRDLTAINKLLDKGQELYTRQKFDSSFYYYNKAKNAAQIAQDTSRIIHALAWMAGIQTNQGDYNGSENNCVEALPYLGNKKKFLYGESNVYTNLANNYLRINEYKNAIYYFKKAINRKTDLIEKANMDNNIAFTLIQMGKTDEAIAMYKILLTKKEVLNNTSSYTRVLSNIGYCYALKNNIKALPYLQRALKIRLHTKDNWGLLSTYSALTDYYKEKNKELAKKYALISYQSASKMNSIDTRLESLKQLIYLSTGTPLKKYSKLFINLNDSIIKERFRSKKIFTKIKYDSKKEKEENIKLKKQEIKNSLKLEIQKNKTQVLYLIILIILITTAFIYYYLKAKSNREKIQASYKTETQIAKKLHDELANDVYQMMKFAETKNLSTPKNKEILLKSLDTVYDRTRNISKENSNIHTDEQFTAQLKMMLLDFNTPKISLIINGLESIEWSLIEDTKKITLYRILQELLVNMKKHSQCSIVVIVLKREKKKLQLSYTDNGIGFNNKKDRHSNGLKNIKNRIESIKGTITFNTILEKGTKINIQFPV